MTGDIYTVIDLDYKSNPEAEITFQWKRNGININNATGISYETGPDDYDVTLSVEIIITNMYGQDKKTLSVLRDPLDQESFNEQE